MACVGDRRRKDRLMRKAHVMRKGLWAAAVAAALATAFAAAPFAVAQNDPVVPPADQPAASAPPAPADVPPAMTVLNDHEVEGILGKQVRSAADENMGRIVDVIVDRSGQVRAAVIDFGGFLGVGSRKIAVDWSALTFPPPGDKAGRVALDLTRDQVKAAPEYQEGKPVVVLGPQGKLEPFTIQ
jgi:PRC-barrel domain